ncbi:hypothetical protein ACGF5O_28125 [Streptomyces sp. NPDC048291]|uniref:hypothetical protein n=1 Tax=Streptomyces sp. NPDC048291 TaxID=3365530 RepID=UPI0037202EA9
MTGAGDIAPVVGGPAMGVGFSVENFLVGTFAGLIVVIAVGTVFTGVGGALGEQRGSRRPVGT